MIEFCRRSRHALDPRSLQSFEKRLSWIEKALERIETGITNEQAQEYLTKDEQLSLELYKLQLGSLNCTKAYQSYLCCVNRIEGPQTDLPLYARYLPVKTHANRCFYRDFLQAIPKQLMEVHELLQHGLKEMRTPPQVSLSGVVEQSREMIEVNMESLFKPIQSAFVLPEEHDLMQECTSLLETARESIGHFADFFGNQALSQYSYRNQCLSRIS
jgi:uncharacterized protein (DUF885 family)